MVFAMFGIDGSEIAEGVFGYCGEEVRGRRIR
jgi:hypothetical protein